MVKNLISKAKVAAGLSVLLLAQMVQLATPFVPQAAAAVRNQGDQPVWCQYTNEWEAQIGTTGDGNNRNRFPLTQLPADANPELVYLESDSGQVYAVNGSDASLKIKLDVYCKTQYQTLPTPHVTITGVCGLDNDVVTLPATNANYTVSVSPWNNGSATVTVTMTRQGINAGYLFSNGLTIITYTINETNRDTCTTTISVPTVPTNDPCGLDNATFGTVPTSTQYTHVRNEDGSITFTAANGFVFTGNQRVVTIYPQDSGTLCTAVTPTVDVTGVCDINNDTTTVTHYDSTLMTMKESAWINGSKTFTFTITNADYTFAGGSTTATVVVSEKSTARCPRHAEPCTVTDNTFISPWTYMDETFPVAGGEGSYVFTNDQNFTGLKIVTPLDKSYVYGLIDAGNTHIADVNAMSYTTYRLPASAGYDNTLPAYILMIDKDGNPLTDDVTYLFYEPYNNGTVTEGTWQTWDAINGGNAKWWMSGTGQTLRTWNELKVSLPDATVLAYGFNQGTYNAQTDTYIKSMTFDCATTTFSAPGRGGVTPPTVTPTTTATPVVTTSVALPALLPETGGIGISGVIVALTAAIATYGAMYYATTKRRYE